MWLKVQDDREGCRGWLRGLFRLQRPCTRALKVRRKFLGCRRGSRPCPCSPNRRCRQHTQLTASPDLRVHAVDSRTRLGLRGRVAVRNTFITGATPRSPHGSLISRAPWTFRRRTRRAGVDIRAHRSRLANAAGGGGLGLHLRVVLAARRGARLTARWKGSGLGPRCPGGSSANPRACGGGKKAKDRVRRELLAYHGDFVGSCRSPPFVGRAARFD